MKFAYRRSLLVAGVLALCVVGIGGYTLENALAHTSSQTLQTQIQTALKSGASIQASTTTGHSTSNGGGGGVSSKNTKAASTDKSLRVLVVGGSVALGWDDKTGGGYLQRAWESYASSKKEKLTFINGSVEGDGPDMFAPKLQQTLQKAHAQILMISWGMLDSISHKTSISTFEKAVSAEISAARSMGMDVMIVTPPVTLASYTTCVTKEPEYNAAEMDAASSYPKSEVQVFDLYQAMKNNLASTHTTIQSLSADGWHPNTAGHELAGKILAEELLNSPNI